MAIGIACGPLVLLFQLKDHLAFFNLGTWNALTSPGQESYHPVWMPLLLFEFLVNGILLCGTVSLWFLFFGRMRAFPSAYVVLSLFGIGVSVADWIGMQLFPEGVPGDEGSERRAPSWRAPWSGSGYGSPLEIQPGQRDFHLSVTGAPVTPFHRDPVSDGAMENR